GGKRGELGRQGMRHPVLCQPAVVRRGRGTFCRASKAVTHAFNRAACRISLWSFPQRAALDMVGTCRCRKHLVVKGHSTREALPEPTARADPPAPAPAA